MQTFLLIPVEYNSETGREKLIVKARWYVNGKFHSTRVWSFPTPVHEVDLFERAYLTAPEACVYLQDNFLTLPDRFGTFYGNRD